MAIAEREVLTFFIEIKLYMLSYSFDIAGKESCYVYH